MEAIASLTGSSPLMDKRRDLRDDMGSADMARGNKNGVPGRETKKTSWSCGERKGVKSPPNTGSAIQDNLRSLEQSGFECGLRRSMSKISREISSSSSRNLSSRIHDAYFFRFSHSREEISRRIVYGTEV